MSTTPVSTPVSNALAGWLATAETRATQANEPAWALEKRSRAAAVASSLAFPSRDEELWRRTDFSGLPLDSLDPFAAVGPVRNIDDLPAALLSRLAGEAGNMALVAQVDQQCVYEQTHPTLVKQGVIVCSLDRAVREHADKVQALLGTLLATDYDRWTAVGEALRSGGVFVWVPKGVHAELPVRTMQYLSGAGRLAAPRTVIVVGDGGSITVVDDLLSENAEGASMYLGGVELFVGQNAKLTYASIQDWSRNVYHYGNGRARIARDGELQWIQVMVGGRASKTNIWYDLDGEGAQAFVHGFMFGDQRQHFHLHTLQRHLKPNCTSDLLIKGCLKDKARSVYQGLIQVAEGAQKTNAYQANRNLLLSDQARADSIPGLEILANDVRCTHGATLGHVDAEHLYYLMARGLPRVEAERLVVEAFFEPVLERIPLESLRDQLRAEIERKIG
ncbi:MAG: Fe-S cluster assembly protein SufD [Candidatus Eisenbacteria bacterium]